jgi:hypothetical protein
MTPATCERLRTAVLALPAGERAPHLAALACLVHLLDHCTEGREPRGFVADAGAYRSPTLHWAAAQLGHVLLPCEAPDCDEPDHVTLTSRTARAWRTTHDGAP